jgi:FkbM family methyltransferase
MSLKTRIRDLAASRGIVFDRESVDNSAAMRRQRLLASLNADVVLDVGANVGVYGQELRRYGFEGRIVSLEPLSQAYARLAAAASGDGAWSTQQVALGDEDGTAEINISASDPWSSLLPAHPEASEPERLKRVGTETVRTARLDSMPEVLGRRTWLKLDVQGFELHVLRGATESLQTVVAIESEISLEPFYEGQPTAREMIDALDDHGFVLAVVGNGWIRDSGRARWMDGTFTRRDPLR